MEDEGRVTSSSEFGILLRRYRIAAGLSQEALAERARVSTSGIGALERGYRRTPQRETLALLVGALALTDEERQELEAAAVRPSLPRGNASVTVGPWPGSAPPVLPLALTTFVGRETELEEISALAREYRLVTLTGTGGVGKTQTVLQVANAMRDANDAPVYFDAPAYFVGLAPISDPSMVTSAIASALGVKEVPNRPLLDTLTGYLKNRSMLLVLDNCEHVITEAAAVTYQLLLNCPRLCILATSREALRAAGERAYRLPSLSLPEAVELFTDRARAVDYHFKLTDEDAQIVANLCARLDGIPLAIELAAARVQVLTPREMLAMLERQFGLLRGGDRIAPARQQTMWATLEWSYELLSKPEQILFDRLSIFAGGCTLDTAIAVCADDQIASGDILDLLSSLVAKSLLTADLSGSEPRYIPLESFRQFGREKLKARGVEDVVARRHALALLETARRANNASLHEGEEVYNELAHAELNNWRAALRWSLADRRDVQCGLRLLGQLSAVWWDFALEGRRWVNLGLDLLDEHTPLEVKAQLRLLACSVACVLGEHEEAYALSQGAAPLCRSIGDSLGILRAQTFAVSALTCLGRTDEAKPALREALSLARELNILKATASLTRWKGWIGLHEGDLAEARACFEEARQKFEAAGNRSWAAVLQAIDLSSMEFLGGNAETALALAIEGIAILRPLCAASRRAPSNALLLADALSSAATYLIALDRYDEAREAALEMLDIAGGVQAQVAAHALQHIAAATALRPPVEGIDAVGARAKAAKMLGFVDARLTAMGSARDNEAMEWEYDRVIAALRTAMGPEAFANCTAAGAAMSEEAAIGLALT